VDFRKFEDTKKLIKYADTVDCEFFSFTMFDLMEL